LREGGIDDLAVLHAFDSIPRHLFVPEAVRHRAYEDAALPLGHGQTISRPSVHASHLCMIGFGGGEKVLEIGAGSGFQTALLSQLAREVHSIEVVPGLAEQARARLARLGIDNVTLHVGDGGAGWVAGAPYDAILVGAAAPRVPRALVGQLADGGRLLIPTGGKEGQRLWRLTLRSGKLTREAMEEARFVPLVGREGW